MHVDIQKIKQNIIKNIKVLSCNDLKVKIMSKTVMCSEILRCIDHTVLLLLITIRAFVGFI